MWPIGISYPNILTSPSSLTLPQRPGKLNQYNTVEVKVRPHYFGYQPLSYQDTLFCIGRKYVVVVDSTIQKWPLLSDYINSPTHKFTPILLTPVIPPESPADPSSQCYSLIYGMLVA